MSKSGSNGSVGAGAQTDRNRRIRGELAEDRRGLFRTVGGGPAFLQQRRAVGGDVRTVDGFIADIRAENSVHEGAAAGAAKPLRGVDRDVYGGLPREPGLEEDLGRGEGDEQAHLLVDLALAGMLDEQGIQEMLVPEIFEQKGCDSGFRREISGAEIVQAVVQRNAVILPYGQGGEGVFQYALGNAGCFQRDRLSVECAGEM